MPMMQSQPENSSERFDRLMQLRCRQEILERWLASEVLTDGLQQSQRAMLGEVKEQLGMMGGVTATKDFTLD